MQCCNIATITAGPAAGWRGAARLGQIGTPGPGSAERLANDSDDGRSERAC